MKLAFTQYCTAGFKKPEEQFSNHEGFKLIIRHNCFSEVKCMTKHVKRIL